MDSPLPRQDGVDAQALLRDILAGVGEESISRLAEAAVERSYTTGELICREGTAGDSVFFIVRGRVAIFKQLGKESEWHLHDAGAGELFGEMAILERGPRTASVRAIEPTTALEIGREEFVEVLESCPPLATRILSRLTTRLRESDQRLITDLRQANEELTAALRRLQRLDQAKSGFIRLAAHELRTPVAALLGYAQMIVGNPIVEGNSELRELVQGVVQGTQRLHRLFDSILDVSRLVDGKPQVNRSPLSLATLLSSILSEVAETLEERSLELSIGGLNGLPLCPGDPGLLRKAFWHLISNAIKYTPDGGSITVSGRCTEAAGLGQCIEVTVADTGVGIAVDDLELIFEKFYTPEELSLHSSGSTSFRGGGPGLGLAVARGVVRAHGGRIWAESPGRDEGERPGSRFIILLPLL
jgi:signal transduction histidine kinase